MPLPIGLAGFDGKDPSSLSYYGIESGMESPSVQELLDRLTPREWQLLHKELLWEAYDLARRLRLPDHHALMSDTFHNVIQRAAMWDGRDISVHAIANYMKKVMRNAALDHSRSKSHRQDKTAESVDSPGAAAVQSTAPDPEQLLVVATDVDATLLKLQEDACEADEEELFEYLGLVKERSVEWDDNVEAARLLCERFPKRSPPLCPDDVVNLKKKIQVRIRRTRPLARTRA